MRSPGLVVLLSGWCGVAGSTATSVKCPRYKMTSSPAGGWVVVVVAFSSLAMILGECSTIHSRLRFFVFVFEVEINLLTLVPLFMTGSVYSSWLSKLRRRWQSVS